MTQSNGSNVDIKEVISLYRDSSAWTRAVVRGRFFLSDLPFVERHVPPTGHIVELGSGHGLFANLMALGHPDRRITGVDLDQSKIDIARQTVGARKNVSFLCGDITWLKLPKCDAVTIVDVMYLMPAEKQLAILDACAQMLSPGGLLVWKAQERRPRWKYAWTRVQELVGTSMGMTLVPHGKMHFMAKEEAETALSRAGFEPEALQMRSWRPYPDILYLGRKRA